MTSEIALLAGAVLLSVVFALAGLAKLADRNGSREAARGFGVPDRLVGAVGTRRFRLLAVLGMLAALLVTATAASSRPTAGIGVTVRPMVVLPYYTASIGTYYIVVTSATWSPPALRTEGAIYIRSCSPESPTKRCSPTGSPDVLSFGNGGTVLHTSESYAGVYGLFAGDRATITAHWRAYIPSAFVPIDGEADSPKYELNVPEGLPPRFEDVTKLFFADLGITMYAECGSLSVWAGVGSVPGFNEVGAVGAGLGCSGGSGMTQLSFDPVDPSFRTIAKPRIPSVPKVAPGGQLTGQAATAFNKLFVARAKEIGYARAVITSINRAQGAYVKKQKPWEERQMRAAGAYATLLASALDQEVRLRPQLAQALEDVGLTEASNTDEDVAAFTESLIREGLPADLVAGLSRLGVSQAEQKVVRGWLLAADPARLAGNPYEKVADPRVLRSLRKASAGLKAFAKAPARKPLETGG